MSGARLAGWGLSPLIVALAVLGGLGSYATVKAAAEPYFGRLAWIVPVGMDIGVLVLLAWDLLLEHLDLTWPVLRWIAWAYICGTVMVNVSAAHGHPAAAVMHAAMPVLFISTMEGVRHLIRQRTGRATGRRIEPIPLARWLLAPLSTAALWRRMVLWHVTGYRDGLELEYDRKLAVSALQQTYGRWGWRWRAPLADRLALQMPGIRQSLQTPSGPPKPHPWASAELVEAAVTVLRNTGDLPTKTALAMRLREQGFAIANGRIAELMALAEAAMHKEASGG